MADADFGDGIVGTWFTHGNGNSLADLEHWTQLLTRLRDDTGLMGGRGI
jgi:hypothetical protein